MSALSPARGVIVLQTIDVQWSKAARGAPLAAARNAVPEGLRLPPDEPAALDADSLLLVQHRVSYAEHTVFAPARAMYAHSVAPFPGELREHGDGYRHLDERLGSTLLRCGEDTLDVVARVLPGFTPTAESARFTLGSGMWARIARNGRTSVGNNGMWVYRKRVVNVGLFAQIRPDAFVGTPDHEFRQMSSLY